MATSKLNQWKLLIISNFLSITAQAVLLNVCVHRERKTFQRLFCSSVTPPFADCEQHNHSDITAVRRQEAERPTSPNRPSSGSAPLTDCELSDNNLLPTPSQSRRLSGRMLRESLGFTHMTGSSALHWAAGLLPALIAPFERLSKLLTALGLGAPAALGSSQPRGGERGRGSIRRRGGGGGTTESSIPIP
ncbi:hypothetical protein MHYP_G00092170 [Metynnis hypsauchen]